MAYTIFYKVHDKKHSNITFNIIKIKTIWIIYSYNNRWYINNRWSKIDADYSCIKVILYCCKRCFIFRFKGKIFKSKSGIKNAINKLQQLNPNYNYKIKYIYRTTKISSYYYYKKQMIQNNKSILMLGNNKQGINNNIHDKRIVLLKK